MSRVGAGGTAALSGARGSRAVLATGRLHTGFPRPEGAGRPKGSGPAAHAPRVCTRPAPTGKNTTCSVPHPPAAGNRGRVSGVVCWWSCRIVRTDRGATPLALPLPHHRPCRKLTGVGDGRRLPPGTPRTDTPARLHDTLATLGGRLIVEALELAACGGLKPVPQPVKGVTYAHKIEKAEALIDWAQSAAQIERRIRAFDPFPGAQTTVRSGGAVETVKLWRSVIDSKERPSDEDNGQILLVNEAGIAVVAGDGVLRITELQRAGGKRLAAADFLRGFTLAPGMRLGVPAG